MSRRRQWGEDSTVRIDLSGGASVSLTFKGNLFDLTMAERDLVADLSAEIQRYRDAKLGMPAAATKKEGDS